MVLRLPLCHPSSPSFSFPPSPPTATPIRFKLRHLTYLLLFLCTLLLLQPTSSMTSIVTVIETVKQNEGYEMMKLTAEDKRGGKYQRITPSTTFITTAFTGNYGSYGLTETFAEFLETRLPIASSSILSPPHIWLTLGGGGWETQVAGQQLFVNTLNRERKQRDSRYRKTEIVVLCGTKECVDYCEERRIWSYGGYADNVPGILLKDTWIKLKGLIDILTTGRDTFFFDADVYFKRDPYPHMNLIDYDLIMSENYVAAHGNTGWTFQRSLPNTIALYQSILDQNLISVSRDQIRTNEVLNTTALRRVSVLQDGTETFKNDFISMNSDEPGSQGIRVHILDPHLFFAFHFELYSAWQEETVFLHMTCGDEGPDEILHRNYLARWFGFGSDLDQYYSSPPQIIMIQDLYGTTEEVKRTMRILVAVAHYTNRAIVPPAETVLTDLYTPSLPTDPAQPNHQRHTYAAFPLPVIARGLDVQVLEPDYIAHATSRYLKSSSPASSLTKTIAALQTPTVLDLRLHSSFAHLLSLLLSPTYSSAQVLRLDNLDLNDGTRHWILPQNVMDQVETCSGLREVPSCARICKSAEMLSQSEGGGMMKKVRRPKGEWEKIEVVLRETTP